jgi:hypothetical protein
MDDRLEEMGRLHRPVRVLVDAPLAVEQERVQAHQAATEVTQALAPFLP